MYSQHLKVYLKAFVLIKFKKYKYDLEMINILRLFEVFIANKRFIP